MTINVSLPANWKTSAAGLVAAAGVFLTSYVQAGHAVDFKDPKLYTALAIALMGYFSKDKNVTGGTVANPANDSSVVAKTATPKAEPPA